MGPRKEGSVKTLSVMLMALILLVGCSSNGSEQPASSPVTGDAATTSTAKTPVDATPVPAVSNAAPATPKTVEVPAGAELNVVLVDSLSSDKNTAGDQFT